MSGEALNALAARVGLEGGYYDGFGNWREAAPEDRVALLRSLGLAPDGPGAAEAAIERLDADDWHRVLPPVLVLQGGGARQAEVTLPDVERGARLRWELQLESGEARGGEAEFA